MTRARRLSATLAALLAAQASGCMRPATEVVLRVDSDLRAPDELRAVRVTLRRTGAAAPSLDETYDLSAGRLTVPGTVGVVPGDPDDARRLEVTVRALLVDGNDFEARALVSFARERTLLLDVFLASRCRDPANRAGCGPDETCGPTGCEPVARAPLPDLGVDVPRVEVAPVDTPDELAPDAEPDAALDAALDVALDAALDAAPPDLPRDLAPEPPPCGGGGEACCAGGACRAGLVCAGARCAACGAAGQPCCAGGACGANTACAGGACVACGNAGQPCCAGRCNADTNPCVTVTCAAGTCRRAVRPDGEAWFFSPNARCCGGVAVNISTNANHCGGCGMRCASGDCEPTGAISCGGANNPSGRCRCSSNAQCPVGRSARQVCRNQSPGAGRCAPETVGGCAPGTSFVDVSFCPNFCQY